MNLIVNFVPTGMLPVKAQTPHVPIASEEIIADVKEAYHLGITMVHLHARDPLTQESAWQKDIYAQTITGIREFAPDLIICVSTSGRKVGEFSCRADVLQLQGMAKPDLASLTLSSLNFNHSASINEPEMIMKLTGEMQKNGILPELEVFDTGMLNYAKYLEAKGLLKPPHYINLILGNISCAQADLLHAGLLINDLPEDCFCSIGAIGNFQLPINSLAIAMGFGVRVGLEDNIWYDRKRTKLARNYDLLQRIHVLAKANEREIMKPAELRKMLGLNQGNGRYGLSER